MKALYITKEGKEELLTSNKHIYILLSYYTVLSFI